MSSPPPWPETLPLSAPALLSPLPYLPLLFYCLDPCGAVGCGLHVPMHRSHHRPPSQITCSSRPHPNPDQSPPPKSVVPPASVQSVQPLNEPPGPLCFLPPSAATLLGLVLALPCTLCHFNVRCSSSICSWNLLSAGEPVSDGCISTYTRPLFLQL